MFTRAFWIGGKEADGTGTGIVVTGEVVVEVSEACPAPGAVVQAPISSATRMAPKKKQLEAEGRIDVTVGLLSSVL
jgi:hypothetical protein